MALCSTQRLFVLIVRNTRKMEINCLVRLKENNKVNFCGKEGRKDGRKNSKKTIILSYVQGIVHFIQWQFQLSVEKIS